MNESVEALWPKNKPQLLPGDDDAVPGEAFYIRREADARLEKQIRRTGTTTIIEGAPQTGKSALLAKAHAFARQNHMLICYLDFHFIESHQLQSLETLYQGLARKIILAFKAPIKVGNYWDESLGTKDNLTYFVEEAILSNVHVPILMIFDEIDPIFHFSYRDDFFATMRGWHNRRAIEENWSRLNLLIAHSTAPYLEIPDLNQSPFNVGQRITPEDFNFNQIAELNAQHNAPLKKDSEIKNLMRLVGGQPLITQIKRSFNETPLGEET